MLGYIALSKARQTYINNGFFNHFLPDGREEETLVEQVKGLIWLIKTMKRELMECEPDEVEALKARIRKKEDELKKLQNN